MSRLITHNQGFQRHQFALHLGGSASTRTQPRHTRSQQRKAMKEKVARKFNATRCLPSDAPSVRNDGPRDEFAPVSDGMFRRCENWLNRSGLVSEIQVRLHAHGGQISRLPVKAVLLGMVLAVYAKQTYQRTDVLAVLCGLDAYQAHRLGLCDPVEGFVQFSYEMLQTQIKRIEDALDEGWEVPADERSEERTQRNLQWFADVAVAHSIPEEHKAAIKSAALDSTAVQTWARLIDGRKEKDAQADLKANPPPPTPPGEPPAIGTNGPHRRIRRTKCVDALFAYTSDGMIPGFDAHFVTSVRDVTWYGDPRLVQLGEKVIPYILGVCVMPGMVNYAQSGLNALEMALRIAPNLNEVINDIGYSQQPRFLTGARKLGLSPVFDYKKKTANKVYSLQIGPEGHEESVLMNRGMLMPSWAPENLLTPPKPLKGKARREWLADRYEQIGYVCTQKGEDGSRRVMCPQCAGKIMTTAPTRSQSERAQPRQLKPRPAGTPGRKPRARARIAVDPSYQCCCGGVRTIPLEQLGLYQDIPHETPAWKTSYGRRNPSETTNSRAKNRNLLRHGWCKAFRIGATSVGTVLVAVVLNLREAHDHSSSHDEHDADPNSPEAQLADAVNGSPTITHKNDSSDHNDTSLDTEPSADPAEPTHHTDATNSDRAPP